MALAIAFTAIVVMNLDVGANPNGASIGFNSTSVAASAVAGNRTDVKGSINTIRLSSVQQNTKWKAYVGNTSGKLTLDDANAYTIYDWPTGSVRGEVYASRSSSVTWSSINCTNPGNLTAEESALGITGSASDSIRNTFNWTGHRAFGVGAIAISNCNSTVTYMNDSNPGQVGTAPFHQALLSDGTAFVYAAIINASGQGYRNDSLYDFQMIVAENTTAGSPALTYFFWVELI